MDRSGQTLEVIDGGRQALERAYMWAILFDRPDKQGRVQILRVHARKIRIGPDVDLQTVAALTPAFPVAVLERA